MVIWDICQGEHHSTKVFLASLCWYGLLSWEPIPFRGLLLGLFFKLRSLMHAQERFERFGVGIRFFWGSQFQSRHLHGTLCSIRLVNCSEDPVADAIPDSSQSRLVPQQLGNCIGEAYYHGVNPNWVQNMTKLNVRLPKRHAMFFVRG